MKNFGTPLAGRISRGAEEIGGLDRIFFIERENIVDKREKKEGPITLTQLTRFYNDFIEPRFERIDGEFAKVHEKLDEHDCRFDDLYKKFEVLHQEYIISNEQIRRLNS